MRIPEVVWAEDTQFELIRYEGRRQLFRGIVVAATDPGRFPYLLVTLSDVYDNQHNFVTDTLRTRIGKRPEGVMDFAIGDKILFTSEAVVDTDIDPTTNKGVARVSMKDSVFIQRGWSLSDMSKFGYSKKVGV